MIQARRIWMYPVVIVVVLLSVVGLLRVSAQTPEPTPTDKPPEFGKVVVPETGAYFGLAATGNLSEEDIANFEIALNRGFDVERVASDSDNPDLSSGHVQDAIRNGRIPWLSIRMADWGAVASGGADNQINALANKIKSLKSSIYLTVNYEPEDEVGAGQTPDIYKAAWQRYHTKFAEAGVTNVSWAYLVKASSLEAGNPLYANATAMYPGDAFVDWIGVDLYNMPYDINPGYDYCTTQDASEEKVQSTRHLIEQHALFPCQADYYATHALDTQWRDLKARVQGAYNWATQTKPGSHTLPLALAEWGVTYDWRNDGRRAQWINTATADLKTMPQLKAITYAQKDEFEIGWPQGVNTRADVTAFSAMADDPYFKFFPNWPPDYTPPSVSITTPPGTYSGIVTIRALATDNQSVDRVAFLVNDEWKHTEYNLPYEFVRYTAVNNDGTYTVTAIAYDQRGNSSTSAPVQITVDNTTGGAMPTIESFVAIPDTITVGETTTLSWVSTNALNCSVTPNGPQNTTDTSWVTPLHTQVGSLVYSLTCNNVNGTVSSTASVIVNSPPDPPAKPTFTAGSAEVMQGENVMLNWSSTGATSCTLQPGDILAVGDSGSNLVENMQATTTFNLTCRNEAGSVSADPVTVTVTEEPPPVLAPEIVHFTVEPSIALAEVTTQSHPGSLLLFQPEQQ